LIILFKDIKLKDKTLIILITIAVISYSASIIIPSIAHFITIAFGSAMLLFLLFEKNSSRHATPPLIHNVIPVIILLAHGNDIAVLLKLYNFVTLTPGALTAVIIIISVLYHQELISLNKEIEELNLQLEDKISDGTMELLFSEFGIKSYIDTINTVTGSDNNFVDPEAIQNLLDYNKASSLLSLLQELEMISGEEELMDRLINQIMHITGASTGILFLLNEYGDMEIKASKNPEGLVSYNFDLVEKTLQNHTWNISTGGSEGNEVYVLTVPIAVGSKNIGVCYLENTLDSSLFNTNIAQIIHAFMSQASLALENIRLRNSYYIKEKKEKTELSDDISEKLQAIKDYIDTNFSSDLSREGLALMVDMHPDTLSRAFKSFSGKKLHDYINHLRIDKASGLLTSTDMNIISIAYEAGFESLTTFNRTFMKIMKKTPTEYRKSQT
jgi:AraC-like DNA-binding protein